MVVDEEGVESLGGLVLPDGKGIENMMGCTEPSMDGRGVSSKVVEREGGGGWFVCRNGGTDFNWKNLEIQIK